MAEIDDKELEALRSQAARVAELEPDAQLGKQHREAEAARLAKEVEKLPASDRKLLEGVKDPAQVAALVARFNMVPATPPLPPGGGTPPPPKTTSDFARAWGTDDWARVRAEDPEGAKAWVDSHFPANQKKKGARFWPFS